MLNVRRGVSKRGIRYCSK